MRRGLLGLIRRHRWAVDLIAGYALILNLLISAVMGTQAIAAAIDPSLAFLDAPICSINAGTEPGKQPQPAKDGSDCPLCGTACPMGGCAPLPAPACDQAVAVPQVISDGSRFPFGQPVPHRQNRYPSDQLSQAPPSAV